MNMNILSIVTPPSIYHGCFIWEMFWEENFTIGEFTPMNMKNCGRLKVWKNRDIKDSNRYTILNILIKFGSMDKIIITYSEPKYYLGRSGKGLITSLGLRTNKR